MIGVAAAIKNFKTPSSTPLYTIDLFDRPYIISDKLEYVGCYIITWKFLVSNKDPYRLLNPANVHQNCLFRNGRSKFVVLQPM